MDQKRLKILIFVIIGFVLVFNIMLGFWLMGR